MFYLIAVPGLLVSFGFIFIGALLAAVALSELTVVWAAQKWPSTPAEVRSSRIVIDRWGYYEPRIEYAFTVDGQQILGKRRAFYIKSKMDRVWADTIVSENPVGARVTVFYDPNNPSQCVLTREKARGVGAVIPVVGFGFSAIGLALLDSIARFPSTW